LFKNHFEAMNDSTIFQNSPTKLANMTWYCTGISQKFIDEASGQIFQLFNIVYHSFYLVAWTPFPNFVMSRSTTIWLKGKKPLSRMGAKTSWSNSMDPNTFTALVLVGKTIACTLGSSLQYHKCRHGAMYAPPTIKKSMFLFQLNGFFSKTTSIYEY